MNKASTLVAAVALGLGITACGYFIGTGIQHLKSNNRYVNVRGLSEREVQADTAQLSISIANSDNEKSALFPKMKATQDKIIAVIKAAGLPEKEISLQQWTTYRIRPDQVKDDPSMPLYNASGNILVKTHNIKAVESVVAKLNELQMATDGAISGSNVSYSFNGISALRAEMIAAATKDARNAALQFAADSGSQVGSISNASQGVFQILSTGDDSDDPGSVNKTVRVVTTVTYELLDE